MSIVSVQFFPARPAAGRPRGLALGTLIAAALLSGCASNDDVEGFDVEFEEPETRIAYEITLEGVPGSGVRDLIEQSIGLYRRQEEGAQSVAFLRKRATDDVATIERILRSRGFYEGTAEIDVSRVSAAADAEQDAEAGAPEAPSARVSVVVEPGPRYTLARHEFTLVEDGGTPPGPLDAAAFGSPVGGGALAAEIVGAEQAAVTELRQTGRPYAEFRRRDAVADPAGKTLEVESIIATGPPLVFGEVSFEGAPNVDTAYLDTYRPWQAGETVDTRELSEFQRRLVGTDLFGAVTVALPEQPPEGPFAPVSVTMEERPFRTIGAGLRFNTDTGPGVTFLFEHRNLFGANERLSLDLEAQLEEQEFDARFSKPQFFRPGQFLEARVRSFRFDDSPFSAAGVTAEGGLRRELSPELSIGAAGLVEFASIDEPGVDGPSTLFGLPAFIAWDSTDNLLNATEGQRARLTATPFTGTFNDEATTFFKLVAEGSTYHDLTGGDDTILAARTRLGTIFAEGLGKVPQTRRFYAGGGGSVRGYDQYFVGPLDERNDPVGGLSLAEVSVEIRQRIWGDVGGVVFVDGGTVSTESAFAFDDDFLVAAGLGLRYYSPVGPIRIDAGFPLNGRDRDPAFQVYFSVGQAF